MSTRAVLQKDREEMHPRHLLAALAVVTNRLAEVVEPQRQEPPALPGLRPQAAQPSSSRIKKITSTYVFNPINNEFLTPILKNARVIM
jgi:hypothetical protein